MVRLLPINAIFAEAERQFQSHNGAIAADKYPPGNPAPYAFQSHNGAIAAGLSLSSVTAFAEVSIPQWCDCCQGKILGFGGKRKGNGEGVAVDLRLPENP